MAVETTNLLLQPNLLQRANGLQTINLLLVPTQIIPPGPPSGVAFGFELEDGSGVIVLEDGTSILLLENQS